MWWVGYGSLAPMDLLCYIPRFRTHVYSDNISCASMEKQGMENQETEERVKVLIRQESAGLLLTFSPWSHLCPLYPGLQVHAPLTWLHILLQPEEQFIKQPDPNKPSGHTAIENTLLSKSLVLL